MHDLNGGLIVDAITLGIFVCSQQSSNFVAECVFATLGGDATAGGIIAERSVVAKRGVFAKRGICKYCTFATVCTSRYILWQKCSIYTKAQVEVLGLKPGYCT